MPTTPSHTDILFISEQPLWPPDQGFRVHGCQMARAMTGLGLNVRMASMHPTTGCDAPWLNRMLVDWPDATDAEHDTLIRSWSGPLAGLRKRVAKHQALDTHQLAGQLPLVDRLKPKAVIALGQHGPIILRALRRTHPNVAAVWYAADEPLYFQLSCLKREGPGSLGKRAYLMAVYAAIHAAFARGLHGAIGVSPTDTNLLKRFTGVRQAVNIPNGVDTDYFKPTNTRPEKCSLIFWGRLDFEPNADAITWFVRHVWPRLRDRQPQARLKIVGKNACEKVRQLDEYPGINMVGEVEDIREHAQTASAVVLPMRCGGGIKNKLLEAAAMGMPILASPKAVAGLRFEPNTMPIAVCKHPDQWVHQIERIWFDGLLNRNLRNDALDWVTRHHTWPAAAQSLHGFLQTMTDLPGINTDINTDGQPIRLDANRLARRAA